MKQHLLLFQHFTLAQELFCFYWLHFKGGKGELNPYLCLAVSVRWVVNCVRFQYSKEVFLTENSCKIHQYIQLHVSPRNNRILMKNISWTEFQVLLQQVLAGCRSVIKILQHHPNVSLKGRRTTQPLTTRRLYDSFIVFTRALTRDLLEPRTFHGRETVDVNLFRCRQST